MTVIRGIALALLGLTVLVLFAPALLPENWDLPGSEIALSIAAANAIGLFFAGRNARNMAQRIGLCLVIAGTMAALLSASLGYWLDAIWPVSSTASGIVVQIDIFMGVANWLALAMLAGIGGGWLLWLIGGILRPSAQG